MRVCRLPDGSSGRPLNVQPWLLSGGFAATRQSSCVRSPSRTEATFCDTPMASVTFGSSVTINTQVAMNTSVSEAIFTRQLARVTSVSVTHVAERAWSAASDTSAAVYVTVSYSCVVQSVSYSLCRTVRIVQFPLHSLR